MAATRTNMPFSTKVTAPPFSICWLIDFFFQPANARFIHAIAATKPGERFMEQLGFEKVESGESRVDRHPFFTARFEDIVVNIRNITGQAEG